MIKINGSETRLESVIHKTAQDFLEENHSQGSVVSAKSVNLGLFHDEDLVAIIQFSSPRTEAMKRKYTVELLRLAFKKGIRIQGGASKLIKGYIKIYNPSDFFTYQDTTGIASDVYEKSGMRLVRADKKKQYLVAPGKTLETGNRKEVLGMAYATRYGPDRILGAKIGEVIREDGSRKSNKQLFIENLGWHVEETTGDRVYEWFNPSISFYTYKITASDSDKYYFGVKRIHKADATVEDCLKDNYFGSGGKNEGNKFKAWINHHKNSLEKEIIDIYSSRQEAFSAERLLVGDKWRDDALCLNSRAGGAISPPQSLEGRNVNVCKIHGEGGFLGNKCRRCLLDDLQTFETCGIHGQTLFFAGSCRKCVITDTYNIDYCTIHGEKAFQKGKCMKCQGERRVSLKDCSIHGMTSHLGSTCALCTSSKVHKTGYCDIHGDTKFVGSKCAKCFHQNAFTMKDCSIHGETKHKGETCQKCARAKAFSKRDCNIHGVSVTFQGEKCMRCAREAKKVE